MLKKVKMSAAGLERLERELEHLITVRRAEVAQKLKEARSFGDLSENAEYDEAKNEQGILEARIQELEITVANAVIVDDADIKETEIGVGSIVEILDLELDEKMTLQIVGSTEADPENNKVSDESPIGRAAIGKKAGDVIEVEAPVGVIKMEILSIGKRGAAVNA